MKKHIFSLVLMVMLVCLLSVGLADTAHIVDDANLLTDAEEAQLEEEILTFRKNRKMDFVIYTSAESHSGQTSVQVADAFYEKGGYGIGEKKSGLVYFIDLSERYHYLSTYGDMIDIMTTSRINSSISTVSGYLSSGNYAGGMSKMISLINGYVRQGVQEGQYRYDDDKQMAVTKAHKRITMPELLVSIGLALAACGITVGSVCGTYSMKGNTYEYALGQNSSVKLTDKEDTFLRTTTSVVRKPQNNGGPGGRPGGGGHFGGGGRVSHVHTSSGGHVHGGGGGHF